MFPAMQPRDQLEAIFLAQIPSVDRMVGALCRRYGVARDETEDVASWVKLRLVEDDYATFAKFRGESSLTTYLTVVVAMFFRDYRAQRWGRWRPSAVAQRRGAMAVRLETLVVRDRVPLRQAAEMLRTSRETDWSDRQLAELMAEFPAREPIRPVEVGAGALEREPDSGAADESLWSGIAAGERRDVMRQLDGAIANLPPDDQVVLKLRFWEDMSVADIARTLGVDQKPLYRRVERLLRGLRSQLEQSGISSEALSFLSETQEVA
jgi:RNA polymerase sigma factor (sigma-70 family)